MSPFCNNLDKGNRVLDVKNNRQGKVAAQPRESSVWVQVTYDGLTGKRRVHIGDLRLIVDGKHPEDVPPCNGEIPESPERPVRPYSSTARPGTAAGTLLDHAKAERSAYQTELDGMNGRAKKLRTLIEKADSVIAILEAEKP